MVQTNEVADLRAEADRLQAQRPDVIKQAFDAHKELTLTEAVEATLDVYGKTQERARALCWGWIEGFAAQCDWDSVRVVLDVFRRRFPKVDGVA